MLGRVQAVAATAEEHDRRCMRLERGTMRLGIATARAARDDSHPLFRSQPGETAGTSEPIRRSATRAYDGEGLAATTRALVEDGRIFGWLTNAAAARQLGAPLTGHASRGGGAPGIATSNVHMEPGAMSPEALMADIADGFYVTDLFGQGVNMVSGDYSRGAAGFRIVKGERAGPVAEITIAGNLLDMFRALTPASDLAFHRAVNVPTLRIDGMMVAGA